MFVDLKFQVADLERHRSEQLPLSEYNDTPLGLILPPPEPEVKDEPEGEGAPDPPPPEIVVPDKDSEDDEEYDMHDNDEGMAELVTISTAAKYQ